MFSFILKAMPTILKVLGYRFHFYSNEGNEGNGRLTFIVGKKIPNVNSGWIT
ncbi:hypothetical protein LEP1GSC062_1868 [Leptospira alexanderi serovar Manhao 3 str. L 60]|uniref:Uncharacterized protein n=1 Tax=Leptospira alexanderi serovar Manhao 3 str. L 60 TaxID=1049759 RepID=V6HT79_9LEPT|nr:hypothetical protein LEP1GSC062_1868 [Leptospira alexanderi serovar Manhao 3 str. L 60]